MSISTRPMKTPSRRALVGCLLVAFLPGCVPAQDEPLRVTVTVPPLAWLVSEVAGPDAEVEHLVDVGEIPETFQPSDLKMTHIARSAVIFQIGIAAENGPWMRALATRGPRIVDLREGLALREIDGVCEHVEPAPEHGADPHRHGEHEHHGEHAHHAEQEAHHHDLDSSEPMDPHVWLSPRRLVIMAETVARSLAEVDRAHAEDYAARAAQVVATLRDLDVDLRERLKPLHGRSFLVFHPAWGYFADDYGLQQVAIEIEGKEPTENELTLLVRQTRREGLRVLFVQPQIRSTTPSTVARVLGTRLETLDPLAADLPANLRRVADRLLVALESVEDGA